MLTPRAAEGLPSNPHGNQLAHVSIIMCVIAGVLVLCRMATRIFIHRALGWDDHTLMLSLALAIGITVCFNMEVYYGMGLHTSELTIPSYKVLAFKWLWIAQLLYKFANALTKISIVLLYLRIFPTRKFKIISWCVIAYVTAYCTAAVFTSIFQCDPIEKAWRKSMDGKCIDIGILWYVNSVLTIIADLILIALPAQQIIRLNLPLAQRLGLIFIFSLGIFVMACTIIRCVALGPTTSKKDSVYYQANSNSWTFLEVDVSIICASLPILKAPISRFFPRIFGSRHANSNNGPTHEYGSHRGQVIGGEHSIGMKDRDQWPHHHHQYQHDGSVKTDVDIDEDAASDEERILGASGIRKTTETTMEYEDRRPPHRNSRYGNINTEKPGVGFEFGLHSTRSNKL